jgi:hypothetical protein
MTHARETVFFLVLAAAAPATVFQSIGRGHASVLPYENLSRQT